MPQPEVTKREEERIRNEREDEERVRKKCDEREREDIKRVREQEEVMILEEKGGEREDLKRAREEDEVKILEDKERENGAKDAENQMENSDSPVLIAVASTTVEEVAGIGERMEQELQQFRQQGAIPRRVFLQQRGALAGIAASAMALSHLHQMPSEERSDGVGQ